MMLVEALAVQSNRREKRSVLIPEFALPLRKSERARLFCSPLVCIHPASGNPMRQWPAARFAELIDILLGSGKFNIALIGNHEESRLTAEIMQRVIDRARVFDFAGRFDLRSLTTLLSRSALFIGNNSGPQHLAAAVGHRRSECTQEWWM